MRFGYQRLPTRRNCNRRSIHRLAIVVPVRSSAASPAATRTARFGWLAALAAAFSALVYVNALDNPFVYDDFRTVLNNPSIEDVWAVSAIVYREMTRPVVNFSYALDRAISGGSLLGYHVTNVLLHVLNVLLLFQIARQRGRGPAGAACRRSPARCQSAQRSSPSPRPPRSVCIR